MLSLQCATGCENGYSQARAPLFTVRTLTWFQTLIRYNAERISEGGNGCATWQCMSRANDEVGRQAVFVSAAEECEGGSKVTPCVTAVTSFAPKLVVQPAEHIRYGLGQETGVPAMCLRAGGRGIFLEH